MVMPAAAFTTVAAAVVMLVVVMSAAAFMIVVMMMAATTFMIVVLVVSAAAALMVVLVMVIIPLANFHFPLHRPGNFRQLFDQAVRVIGSQPQLLCGKGDDCLLHLRQGIEFFFDFRRTVGAVQIPDAVYFLCHDLLLFKST